MVKAFLIGQIKPLLWFCQQILTLLFRKTKTNLTIVGTINTAELAAILVCNTGHCRMFTKMRLVIRYRA